MTTSSDRETAQIELAGRTVTVYRPTEGQWVRLMRVSETVSRNAEESGPVTVKAVLLFDKILASLFAEQDEWDVIEEELATGAISEEFYLETLQRVANAFGIPLQLEEETGPKRPTKRAAPAAKRASRPTPRRR